MVAVAVQYVVAVLVVEVVVVVYVVAGEKMLHFVFETSRFQVLRGIFVQNFAQIFEELTASDQHQVIFRINIKQCFTPKIESTLKPSNYQAKPWFSHKSPNVHAVFLRDRP